MQNDACCFIASSEIAIKEARRGAAWLNWRWFCINFWPPRNIGAVGTEMIDNYYYLLQEYTHCRISETARGEISLGGRLSRIGGFTYSHSGYCSPFLRAILRIVRITWLQRPINRASLSRARYLAGIIVTSSRRR